MAKFDLSYKVARVLVEQTTKNCCRFVDTTNLPKFDSDLNFEVRMRGVGGGTGLERRKGAQTVSTTTKYLTQTGQRREVFWLVVQGLAEHGLSLIASAKRLEFVCRLNFRSNVLRPRVESGLESGEASCMISATAEHMPKFHVSHEIGRILI